MRFNDYSKKRFVSPPLCDQQYIYSLISHTSVPRTNIANVEIDIEATETDSTREKGRKRPLVGPESHVRSTRRK